MKKPVLNKGGKPKVGPRRPSLPPDEVGVKFSGAGKRRMNWEEHAEGRVGGPTRSIGRYKVPDAATVAVDPSRPSVGLNPENHKILARAKIPVKDLKPRDLNGLSASDRYYAKGKYRFD